MQEYVDVEGTEEIQELSKAYNTMLERINQYIEERMKIQEEKRNAEIHALQMQINPHLDRKSTRLNSSHSRASRMPSSA